MAAQYANSSNQIAALKELYSDNKDYMQNLVYKKNPFLALIPKNESQTGLAGKYLPVPIQFGNPQGRSHTFANAQANQTPTQMDSFFVYVIRDYQLVTITNLFMEQTKSDVGAFLDGAKNEMDNGIKNITNNIAFGLFNNGTATRGIVGTQTVGASPTYVAVLASSQTVVQFEIGMVLVASATSGGAPSTDYVQVTAVNRVSGTITGLAYNSSGAAINSNTLSGNWANGAFLSVMGDLPSTGATTTGSFLAISGLAAWLPLVAPTSGDNFWGVDRSADPTRLAGIRYDASAYTIEEGITNALALLNREGGQPDYLFLNFASYAALINSLGAKVQYVQVKHDTAEVAFEAVLFHSAYGVVNVIADRSCPANIGYLLQMDTWKLRTIGPAPHILTYGMEGLEGLRVGNADALEIRMGMYGNLVCNAPGYNAVVVLSA